MTITKKQEWEKINRMLDESLKRIQDYLSEGRGSDSDFAKGEDFQKILQATSEKFKANEPDNAASSFIMGTSDKRIWFDVWTEKLGIDFSVLRWRLLYYDGRNHNHFTDCFWHWPDDRFN